MKQQEESTEVNEEKEEFSDAMRQNLNGDVEKLGARILQMKIKAPQTKEGYNTKICLSTSFWCIQCIFK